MTVKEIIDGLKFTVDMFLFDPTTGETYTEPRNDMDKTTIDACNGAIELLEQTRWIPCNERLPKDYSSCLCTIRNHYTYDNHIEVYDHVVVYNPAEKEWLDESSKLAFEVIAWMPLPEPYRESEEEK